MASAVDQPRILVTGANGYIGARVVAAAVARGWTVTALARRPLAQWAGNPRIDYRRWDLQDDVAPDAVQGCRAIIHLAHRWELTGEDVNLSGTLALVQAARRHGVRFVFGSSISAREAALNRYGQGKWAAEQLLCGPDELIARIGLVYGGPLKGQWGMLARLSGLVPVLPMLAVEKPTQHIHVDDLADALVRLATLDAPARRIYGLANPDALPFGKVLTLFARHLHARPLWVLPIPLAPVMAGVAVLTRLNLLGNVRERILGLAGITRIDTQEALAELGVSLRPLEAGLAAEAPRRRLLVAEAGILLGYVGGDRPGFGAVRDYVRGVERLGEGRPLVLGHFVRRWPCLLAACEPVGADSPLAQRLQIAALVLDAHGGGPYCYAAPGMARSLLSLAKLGLVEAVLLPLRLLRRRKQ